MSRLLAAIFACAFALGVLGAVLYLQHAAIPQHAAAANKQADTPADKNKGDGDDDDDASDAAASKWPDDAGTPEQVMYAQAALMQDALKALQPRAAGRPNLYLIGFAGDGSENVFRNEVEFVQRQFSQRFDAAGRTLLLINNPDTLTRVPLASLSNLQIAVDEAAQRMNADEDILFLFLTSHGSREHELYVGGLDPLPLDQIAPDDLADVFTKSAIRYRVIVISACYSGGFIDALKNDTTMVITAARADRTSFGCGTQSEITDFGRAFFVDGLNHNDSFEAAFDEASHLVDSWESRDDETHSYPQIEAGPAIKARLKAWRAGLHLGPPLPFRTSTPPHQSDGASLTAMLAPIPR